MSDELKENEKSECKCFCKSEGFRNFLTVALGSFVGVFFALSLFAALHKPPVMPPCGFGPHPGMRGCPVKMMHHHFYKGQRPEKPNFQRPDGIKNAPVPFEAQRPEAR